MPQITPALLSLLLLLPTLTRAQDAKPNHAPQAKEVTDYLLKHYLDPKSGVFNRSIVDKKPDYIWRQAAAFSTLVGAARHDPQTYRPLLKKHFEAMNAFWDTQTKIPAYEPAPTKGNGHDKYYDDNAWLVITFAEAYQLTKDPAFLTRAKEVADFVASGYDEEQGGGIWWHQNHNDNSKNTCANGPGAVGFLAIARLTQGEESKKWQTLAEKTTAWTTQKLQDKDALFDDRLIVATGEIKRGKLTYNSALMQRANLHLYRQTNQQKYLDEAIRISKASTWFLDSKTGLYRDPMKWSQFMVEANIDLYRTTHDPDLLKQAQSQAEKYYQSWKSTHPDEMMITAGTARILWLLADTESEKAQAFWKEYDQR